MKKPVQPVQLKETHITDFFQTERVRSEEPFAVKMVHLFDDVNENSLTVDHSESTFDGYNASINLLDLEKVSKHKIKFEFAHGKIFDSMSMASSQNSKGGHPEIENQLN